MSVDRYGTVGSRTAGATATVSRAASHPSAKQPSASEVLPFSAPSIVFAERNLATLGLFSTSGHRIRGSVKTITLSHGPDGQRHVVQVLSGGNLGLLTTADQDKLVALPRAARNWPGRPLKWTSASMLRTLGLQERSGKHYRNLGAWVDRLASTTIISERGLRVAGVWRYQRERVHLVERAISVGQQLPDGSVAEENHLWLSEWLHHSLATGYTLEIDLDWYLRLGAPLARTLALPLMAWLEASKDRGRFEKRWPSLAEFAGLRPYQHPSKVREKLGPALDELRRAGLFAHWDVERTRSGDGLKVTFCHARTATTTRPSPRTASSASAPKSPAAAAHLLDELVRRGVHRGPALRLLERLPADQPVAQQVAWFDALIASRSGSAIQDPPAFLYQLIRDGHVAVAPSPPASSLETPSPKPMHHYQLLQAYNRYLTATVAAHIEGLAPDERERLINEHLAAVLAEDAAAQRWPADQQRIAARRRLEQHFSRTLPVRSLREFMAEHDRTTMPGIGGKS